MRKSRFSEHQIISLLKQGETGVAVADICREHGISKSTYYSWKAKYGGMETSEQCRLRQLETENRRLKEMYAELSLEHRVLQEALEKKCNGCPTTRTGRLERAGLPTQSAPGEPFIWHQSLCLAVQSRRQE